MRFKKIIYMSIFLISIPFFLTGCKTEVMKSPEKLLEKPISNESNYRIYTEVRKLTPIDTSFVLPRNSNDVGKINIVDLNKDGHSQVIAFKKKINEEQGIGSIYMYLFENKRDKIINDSERMVRITGENLKSVNFVDIKGNGKKQIVLHVSNRGFENIYIYEYSGHNLKKIADFSTSNFNIKLNFYRYNEGEKVRCLALLQDDVNYNAYVSRMVLQDGEIIFEKDQAIKDMDGLEKTEFVNGRVSKNIYGTMLVYQSFTGNINTEIIVFKDDKFHSVIDGDNIKMKNTIFMKPVDIDHDGVLDVPKIEFRYTNSTSMESNVISWYQWNGNMSKKDGNMILRKQIYYCYDDNFKIAIPKKLENKFYIQQYFENNKSKFTFYYDNNEGEKKSLFRIDVIKKTAEDVESKTKNDKLENVLIEDENYRYIYEPIDKDLLKEYSITLEKIKKLISLINT